VVITKTHNLFLRSCNHTGNFPRNHRSVLGERIDRNLYDLLETILRAKFSRQRQHFLPQAPKELSGGTATQPIANLFSVVPAVDSLPLPRRFLALRLQRRGCKPLGLGRS
jgi:hypothetical protein